MSDERPQPDPKTAEPGGTEPQPETGDEGKDAGCRRIWHVDQLSGEKSLSGERDHRVAVIGSGPAGLGCAHDLALMGYGVTVFEESTTGFRTVDVETRPETETVIIDMPANIKNDDLRHVTYDANSILIPVMPSPIDIYGASRFIAELLLNAQLDRRDCQVAVVANRTRENTNSYKALMRFLTSLKIPLLTSLRDSQNYIRAAANGLSIYELPAYMVRKDLEQMDIVTNWLNGWQTRSVGNVDMATEEPVESQYSETMLIPQHLRVAN